MTPALAAVTEMAARQVLRSAADRLEALTARVSTVDVTCAVVQSANALLPEDARGASHLAYDALDVLTEHRRAAGEDPRALDRWSSVFPRVEICAQMRSAAEQAPGVAA
ncbi:hypothetical protein ACWEU6_36140 [Streptosporangium sandarakinum]